MVRLLVKWKEVEALIAINPIPPQQLLPSIRRLETLEPSRSPYRVCKYFIKLQ